MKKTRYFEIDFIKSVSALSVILIHTLGRYSDISYVNDIWIWAHFAVGSFVIASGFLAEKSTDTLKDLKSIMKWLKGRVIRLVGPYYVYVGIHMTLILVLPSIFDRISVELTPRFLFETITLHSGFGQNWIPRLFILMTLLYAVVQLLRHHFKLSEKFYTFLMFFSLIISTAFLVIDPSFTTNETKYVQTLTWFSLFLFGILLKRKKDILGFFPKALATTGAAAGLAIMYILATGGSTSVFAHKYPPSLYFIAYNIFATLIVYKIGSFLRTPLKRQEFSSKLICFLSRHSYTIFFAHILIMDIYDTPTDFWLTDFLLTSTLTVFAVILWRKMIELMFCLVKFNYRKGADCP